MDRWLYGKRMIEIFLQVKLYKGLSSVKKKKELRNAEE